MKVRGHVVDGRPIESSEAYGRFLYKERPGYYDGLARKGEPSEMDPDAEALIGDLATAYSIEENAV